MNNWFKYIVIGLFGIAFLSLLADLSSPPSPSLPYSGDATSSQPPLSEDRSHYAPHYGGGSSWFSYGMGALTGYLWGSRPTAPSYASRDRMPSQLSREKTQVVKSRKSRGPVTAKRFAPTRKKVRSVRSGGFGRRASRPTRMRSFRRR